MVEECFFVLLWSEKILFVKSIFLCFLVVIFKTGSGNGFCKAELFSVLFLFVAWGCGLFFVLSSVLLDVSNTC